MYCTNCGNKVHENAYVCVKCGVILNKSNDIKLNNKDSNASGIISIIFASLALILCFNLMTTDISDVVVYSSVFGRLFYGLNFNIFPIIMTTVSMVLGCINLKEICNKIGLALSFLSIFLIITEFAVIILY